MRMKVFGMRTGKEVLRDPLSYIFCLGFPIVMLLIMTLVNAAIPAEANMTLFSSIKLVPGIAGFGLTFVMLFTCLQISKDRGGSFMIRLYASPMKSADFIGGYTIPMLIIAMAQVTVSVMAGMIVMLIKGESIQFLNSLITIPVLIPSALLFIAFGLLFGSSLNEKAAPGICSIIITASCMLGGIFMDVDALTGGFKTVCRALPFYHGIDAARKAFNGEFAGLWAPLAMVSIYAVVIYMLAVFVFHKKMQSDKK